MADQRSKGSTAEPDYEPYKVEDLNYKQKIAFNLVTDYLKQAVDKSTPHPEQKLVNLKGKLNSKKNLEFFLYIWFAFLTKKVVLV